MSTPQHLEAQGLLPFRTKIHVPLADLGLVLVQAENRVSAIASSNGSGKTSLFSLLSWILFDETLDGRSADDVVCRFIGPHDPADGLVTFPDWQMVRSRRPIHAEITEARGNPIVGKEIAEAVEARLGFGFRTFKNAIVFGQGAFERFRAAKSGEQLRMIDELQGLDLRGALERAKAWRDDTQRKHDETEQWRLDTTRDIAAAEALIAELTHAHEAFAATKRQRIADATTRTTEAAALVTRLTAALPDGKALETKIAALLKTQVQRLQISTDANSARAEAGRLTGVASSARSQVARAQADLEALIAGKQCPTCRQATTNAKAVKAAHAEVLKELEVAATHAESEAKISNTRSTKLDKALADTPDTAGEVGQLREVQQRLPGLLRELEAAKHAAAAAQTTLTAEQAATWDGANAHATATKGLTTLRTALAKHEAQLPRLAATLVVAAYWVEAFGDRGIRSLLFDGAAYFLTARIQHHLSFLGAGEVQMAISAQSALKGGGVRERISLTPEWAWGAKGAAGGSAGQDRRVDLALFAALQDLAESRSAKPFPLKVLDEPLDALDARGKELAMAWVRQMARERSSVFLITHSPEIAETITPDHVYTIIMERDGARVEI